MKLESPDTVVKVLIPKDATAVEQDLMTTLEVCYEFYLRGFEFLPISIYDSHATKFLIKDGKILPPFVAVSGLGESAAWDIMEGREGKEFISNTDALSADFDSTSIPANAAYAKVVIVPTEDAEVGSFEVAKYAKMLTITLGE